MKKLSVLAVLLVASLVLVACGGGGSSTNSGSTSESTAAAAPPSESEMSESGEEMEGMGGSTIAFEANPEGQLMFTAMTATGKAGDDTIEFKNPSSTPHNVAIEDSAGKTVAETKTITEGETSTKVELEAGEYTFFCSIPGHREAGMEGTLTIK
jgi:plastocyanin